MTFVLAHPVFGAEPTVSSVFDFAPGVDHSGWRIEDDGVMGGVSKGHFRLNDEGHAVFEGRVSLENNGGFSSVQYFFPERDIRGRTHACIRLRGDGKGYRFIVEGKRADKHYYSYRFTTTEEWQTVRIPLAEMVPYSRGDRLELPNFPAETLSQVRFLIGNGRAESFRLLIDKIWLE